MKQLSPVNFLIRHCANGSEQTVHVRRLRSSHQQPSFPDVSASESEEQKVSEVDESVSQPQESSPVRQAENLDVGVFSPVRPDSESSRGPSECVSDSPLIVDERMSDGVPQFLVKMGSFQYWTPAVSVSEELKRDYQSRARARRRRGRPTGRR